MSKADRSIFCLLLSCLWSVSSIACAGSTPEYSKNIDKLERQLELGRHKQFMRTKLDPDNNINQFTTDGCSGGLSVGWLYLAGKIDKFDGRHGNLPPWESCCITHDHTYHNAGSDTRTPLESFSARKKADLQLMQCIQEVGIEREPELMQEYNMNQTELHHIYQAISLIMYRAVRIGGVPCTGLPWRWGYGWPECDTQ